MSSFPSGRRLSVRGELCTVRYFGPVYGKPGDWLGVEWDNPTRGKHNGTFNGREYFKCRSKDPCCASFLSKDAYFDKPRSVHEAIRDKYASSDVVEVDSVRISGKTIEETGYDKISRRQAKLNDLKAVIISDQRVTSGDNDAVSSLDALCPSAVEVDIAGNLIESMHEVERIISGSHHLESLSLEGNRLSSFTCQSSFSSVKSLNLDSMLLLPEELRDMVLSFPNLEHLSASANLLLDVDASISGQKLASIHLDDNGFDSLQQASALVRHCQRLTRLSLKYNNISSVYSSPERSSDVRQSLPIIDLDLTGNKIKSWNFIDDLQALIPSLRHLKVSKNPIYEHNLRSNRKVFTQAEVSMLIVARLKDLQSLNYTAITDRDRLNAETFYLTTISEELSSVLPEVEEKVLSSHPRYSELCEEYGRPSVVRSDKQAVNPNSIAARLIRCHLSPMSDRAHGAGPKWTDIPQSFSIYSVYSHIARLYQLRPTDLCLTWETGEKDPPGQGINVQHTIVEWDSEDEEERRDWVDREVELVPGTRPLGTIVDGREAKIRVEFKQ